VCKVLIAITLFALLITFIADIIDNGTRGFLLVYIPLLLSLMLALLAWRDMRPKYRLQWQMRDGTNGRIATEPMVREWLSNNRGRERMMDNLAAAMNEALAGKSWWPDRQQQIDSTEEETEAPVKKTKLTLVTDNYE